MIKNDLTKYIKELMGNFKTRSWIIFGIIIVNIIAFMILTNSIYLRLDMTKNKNYSISKPTVELLKKLDSKMTIEYYYNDKFKENNEMGLIAQYVEDILGEYERAGRGNVSVIIKQLDLDKDAEKVDELKKQGIQAIPLSQRQKAESKTSLGLSGILITYKNTPKAIPFVFEDTGFEYVFDSEIKKLIDKDSDTVGVVFGMADKDYYQDFRVVQNQLAEEFKTVKLINSGENIPDDVSVIFIIGGAKLTDYDIFQIDQFLMRGGKAFISFGGVNVIINQQYGQMIGIAAESKLFDLLSGYGLKVNKDMIGDHDSSVPFPDNQGQLHDYPTWLKVVSSSFDKKNPVLNGLSELYFFWSSSIDVDPKIKDQTSILAKTTNNSWAITDNFRLNYDNPMFKIPGQKSYNIMCSFSGDLDSYFKDKNAPENKNGVDKFNGKKLDRGNAKIILISDEYFLWDVFLRQPPMEDDRLLLANSLDWLSKDKSLIEIRNKGKFFNPLNKAVHKDEADFYKTIIIIISTVVVPLLFIGLAVFLYISRYRKNQILKNKFKK